MNRKITTPVDKDHWLQLRLNNLNSTEISALFDINPYLTKFELWHQKKNKELAPFQDNDRAMWGGLLEPVIAGRAALQMGVVHEPLKDYFEIPELRIGSSFDFVILKENSEIIKEQDKIITKSKFHSLMEIKNVDGIIYAQKWVDETGDPEEIEAPPHIEIQVQSQLLVSGLDLCYICVLVGGNDLKIIPRKANPKMQQMILDRCAEFWKSIDENTPPDIDWNKDSSFLIDLYGSADDEKVLEADDETAELVKAYIENNAKAKLVEAKKSELKAKILEKIKDAAKVVHPDFSISAGNTEPSVIKEYVRAGFRNFRVFEKNKKKAKDD